MRIRLIACGLSLLSALPALAQDAPGDLTQRRVSIMAGIGNIFGGFGATAEAFPFHRQVGLVGGVGYVPDSDNSMAGAGALRFYTGGQRHRLFAEGSFGPVAVSIGNSSSTTHYGLGAVQLHLARWVYPAGFGGPRPGCRQSMRRSRWSAWGSDIPGASAGLCKAAALLSPPVNSRSYAQETV